MHSICWLMLTHICKAPPHNNLASLLSGLDSAPVQQSIESPVVARRKANQNNALLQDLSQQQVPEQSSVQPQRKTNQNSSVLQNFLQQQAAIASQAVLKVKPQHSKGQIGLYLQQLESESQAQTSSSPKKIGQNKLLLENFLQKTQSPLYQEAMIILSDKQLQNEYRQNMASIQLFFMNYSMQELQSFHVNTSVVPHNLTSMLDELSAPSQSQTISKVAPKRNNLANILSSMSQDSQITPQKNNAKPRNNAQLLALLRSQG